MPLQGFTFSYSEKWDIDLGLFRGFDAVPDESRWRRRRGRMWQQGKEGQFIEEESTVQRGDAPGWGEGVVPQKGGYQGFTM